MPNNLLVQNSTLWKKAFLQSEDPHYKALTSLLIAQLFSVREKSSALVSEISIDLPGYTVHDVTHLDALWEIGSQITGPDLSLNPAEGFVLGCSFLFHDAAMTVAAYPGGLAEIRESKAWKKVVARLSAQMPSKEHIDEAAVLEVFLREQHAARAGELPFITWESSAGPRMLIEDADLRQKFGAFIGQISASHWWDHGELEKRFGNKVIPAPSPFPSEWSLDILKLACILRAADAAQIDDRRAPGFLWALRKDRLSEFSSKHWLFQNRLTQAQRRSDALFFASTDSFRREEASEWWMLYDTLKMIDAELRKTDDLLSRNRGDSARFAARKVANVDTPLALTDSIPTRDWEPIDTSFSIADIPRLIENLGGSQLYGDDSFVAVRELVQNGMDASRIRRLLEPSAPSPCIQVDLDFSDNLVNLTVHDNGVGMSAREIVKNLLSFGASGWLADKAFGEYTDEIPSRNAVSGRYGIGFFSVFMLGEQVTIISRRFDETPDDTVVLEFSKGLNQRPILYLAEYQDRKTAGGTTIKVQLNAKRLDEAYWRANDGYWRTNGPVDFWSNQENAHRTLALVLGRTFPTSEIPIVVNTPTGRLHIDGGNWETEPAAEFLSRVTGGEKNLEKSTKAVRLVKNSDGRVVGRASLLHLEREGRFYVQRYREFGTIVSKGAVVGEGRFCGVFLGEPVRAARDYAMPAVDSKGLANWATEQAHIWKHLVDDEDQGELAELVAACGGDVADLKICEIDGRWYSKQELRQFLNTRSGIWVAQDAAISLAAKAGDVSGLEEVISVAMGLPTIFDSPYWGGVRYSIASQSLEAVVQSVIKEAFEIDEAVMEKMNLIEDGAQVYMGTTPAVLTKKGGIDRIEGQFFCRQMTSEQVDEFFVPPSRRG